MVYKRVRIDYLIKQVTQGFHATVFAYGQTGSGKTYTMDGRFGAKIPKPHLVGTASSDEGLIPRSIRHLFEMV